jgi:hypothetical protein
MIRRFEDAPDRYRGMLSSLLVLAGALIVMMVPGCGGSHQAMNLNDLEDSAMGVKPPRFLAGPTGELLTNVGGFSARITMEISSSSNKVRTVSGTVLGQGTHLLFAPEKGDRSFIWDVAGDSGYVLSEALQGYAPISSTERVTTNIDVKTSGVGTAVERANGYRCQKGDLVTESSDGSRSRFTVWRADDAKGFPVRIKAVEGWTEFTINFSAIRLESLPGKLFLPPEDFTKYVSADAMMTELSMRQSAVKKRREDSPLDNNWQTTHVKGSSGGGPPQ